MEALEDRLRGAWESGLAMPADRTLLGRESEIEHLEQLLDQAPARGAALLVRGEPGVGKSALLNEAGRRASERGMPVLRTTGHLSEAQLPFAGLHQLLRPVTPQIGALPLAQRDALLGAFGSGRDAPDLFLVALATLTLLSDAAARTSLLLIADDARWLDSPSREVLAFIARRLESDPIVLLIAIRDGDVDRSELPELHLEGLDEDAAEALLDSNAGDLPAAVRQRVLAKAGGNPLALLELPIAWTRAEDATLLDDLPLTERLEHTFAARVNELPAVTRAMLLIAALNDQDSLAEMLRATAILTDATPRLQDLAPAEAAQLVDLRGHGLRFCHPLIRSAIAQMEVVPFAVELRGGDPVIR
jgi:predicted ATPase